MDPKLFFDQNRTAFFDDREAAAEYARAWGGEELDTVLRMAGLAAENQFLFQLRWDLEQTQTPEVFDGPIDWLRQPGDDPEFVYAFNRMRFWPCMGQAYAVTGDEKYARAFADQLVHWVDTVRRDDPACGKAWRTIEAGIRMENWCKAMRYFEGSPHITSEVMDIFTRNRQLARADFVGAPMMANRLDSIHYNQIAGKEMTAYFRDNAIWLNKVNGNARTLYYNQDGEPPQITGLFFIESGGIDFYVEENQVVRMVWTNEPHYTIDPIDKLPPDRELYLKGFKWEGARRPALEDVFDRRIRPSEREERSALQHPDFPLQRRIEAHRKELVEQRRWADRVDQVDPNTAEWMRELGFEVGQPRTGGPKF